MIHVYEDVTGDDQRRIAAAIDALRIEPRPRGYEKLKGRKDQYRIRVGDYRVSYSIEDKVLVILVLQNRESSRRLPETSEELKSAV